MSFLISVLSFIVAIGILVSVHEFGHFWVARKLGIKVLRFSIGFGKPLFAIRGKDDVEYVVSAVPLGGYVKMLDEREGEVPVAERPLAFNNQVLWKRFAVVFAGPFFNFLFAIAAYALMFVIGVQGVRPYVGAVVPGTPAAVTGLQAGDLIRSVDGDPVETWEEARLAMLQAVVDQHDITLQVANGAQERRIDLKLNDQTALKHETDLIRNLGMVPFYAANPYIAGVEAGGAAAKAGLKKDDRVLEIDGRPAVSVPHFIDVIRQNPDKTLQLLILRDGARQTLPITPGQAERKGQVEGYIGAKVGAYVSQAMREEVSTIVRKGPVDALGAGLTRTWAMSSLTVQMFWNLLKGDVSIRNISGPITIAEYAGISASIGISAFLSFLALISVSLGVLNLLPIPVLDGGHLLSYLIEFVKGSPVSEEAEALGQRIGLAIIAALMVLAFYNDLSRLFH
jgi:regulator of sigma E protease